MTFLASLILFLGSYCSADEEGVRAYSFDENTGEATYLCGTRGLSNPSFLCVSKNGKHIYTVGEDGKTASANFLNFDRKAHSLTLMQTARTNGSAPCNIILYPNERHLVTANYMGGSISIFDVNKSGYCAEPPLVESFTGAGYDPERQEQAHLHAVNFTPDGKYLVTNDLGHDKLRFYKADGSAVEVAEYNFPKGTGPRHLTFAPNGKFAYLISELSGEIFTFEYNKKNPNLFELKQTVKADVMDAKGSADIHLSPDSRFVYASHRLEGDGVSIYKVLSDGTLERVGFQATGIHPRNFAITPNGKFMLVACRDSNDVEIFERNISTGLLTDTGKRISMSKPVCAFLKKYK